MWIIRSWEVWRKFFFFFEYSWTTLIWCSRKGIRRAWGTVAGRGDPAPMSRQNRPVRKTEVNFKKFSNISKTFLRTKSLKKKKKNYRWGHEFEFREDLVRYFYTVWYGTRRAGGRWRHARAPIVWILLRDFPFF